MATQTKTKAKTPEEELDEQIEVFEPSPKSVKRKLTLNGETREYVQHEMGFLTKLKFFRALSSTIRLASEGDSGGISGVLEGLLGQEITTGSANSILESLLRLIELSPEFVEETYMYALSVPPAEWAWAQAALEELDDEAGMDILEVFIGQNGEAIRDFFTKRLRKLGKQINFLIPEATEQE